MQRVSGRSTTSGAASDDAVEPAASPAAAIRADEADDAIDALDDADSDHEDAQHVFDDDDRREPQLFGPFRALFEELISTDFADS